VRDANRAVNDADRNNVKAAARGVLHGADDVTSLLVDGARVLSRATNAYKIGRSPQEQADFLEAADHPSVSNNPFAFGKDLISRWLGPSTPDGLQSLIESSAEFGTSGEIAGRMMKTPSVFTPLVETFRELGSKGVILTRALRTVVAGYISSDPHSQRLASILSNYLDQAAQEHDQLEASVRTPQQP
jgi:hypothetical protein